MRLFVKNRRILQFALAGFVLALTSQAAGYAMDRAMTHGGLDNPVLYNWLCLVFAPLSLLPRLTNPDAPLFGSWSIALLVVMGNAIYYAALCKFLQLVFLRLSRNPLDGNVAGVKSNSASAARRIHDPAFDLRNV